MYLLYDLLIITYLTLYWYIDQWNILTTLAHIRGLTQVLKELMYFCSGIDANGECGSNVFNTVDLDLATHLFYHTLANT
jgi:hypothetical protein